MKKFITTLSLLAFATSTLFAQEIPAELKSQLETKSLEVSGNDANKAKLWVRKQLASWESLQYMSFSIDENDVKLIKAMADKKFPLDFVAQEKYIGTQADAANYLSEYKIQLGADNYDVISADFKAKGEGDITDFVEFLKVNIEDKTKFEQTSSEKLSPVTLAFLKKSIQNEYKGNFNKQFLVLDEILNQSVEKAASIAKTQEPAEPVMGADGKPVAVQEVKKVPLTFAQRDIIAKDMFNKQTYLVEGERTVYALLTEIKGRQVALLPASAYFPGVTLANPMGEQLEYDEAQVYSSKNVPLIMIFPKEIKSEFSNSVLLNDKQYREVIGTSQFSVGISREKLYSRPAKIMSMNVKYLNLDTKLMLEEGSLIVNTDSKETIAMLLQAPPAARRVNWLQRTEVNKIKREMEYGNVELAATKLNRLGPWVKVDQDNFIEQQIKADKMKKFIEDILNLFTQSSLSDSETSPIIGNMVKKHMKVFSNKTDKSTFERNYRSYLQELSNMIKAELRTSKEDFYATYQPSVANYANILEQALKAIETASKGSAYMTIIQNDVKRLQDL